MISYSGLKYQTYLKELHEFQNQGENLKKEEFESWEKKVLAELDGNYKIRFSQLQFYSIVEKTEDYNNNDDLPF